MIQLVECQFCRTNAKLEPCPRPEGEHRQGFEIHGNSVHVGTITHIAGGLR